MMQHIAIHSVPRSGSSWLGEILNSSPDVCYAFQPLFSYAFKGRLQDNSELKEINDFYRDLLNSDDDFVTQAEARRLGTKPLFEKHQTTHVAYKEVRYHYILENLVAQNPTQKVIGLVRHPLAVLSSWKNAPREFRADMGWSFKDEWKKANLKNQNRPEEYFGYDKWKETTLLFKRLNEQYPDNVKLVHYSNLLGNTMGVVKAIFDFLELDFTHQTKEFIEHSSNRDVIDTYSVFKTKKVTDTDYHSHIPDWITKEVIEDCKMLGLDEFLGDFC
jgi:hypothetical protein